MFSILQQVKIAMSNKNDPYNYANAVQNQRETKNIQDTDLESIAGSVQRGSPEKDEVTLGEAASQKSGWFGNFFGLGKDSD
jgi:hypothetical protein